MPVLPAPYYDFFELNAVFQSTVPHSLTQPLGSRPEVAVIFNFNKQSQFAVDCFLVFPFYGIHVFHETVHNL
jgi:hypothetical protein